ncbi:hypothetical protein [Phyllobacterium salinisoli]|uniref:hypothetical protein n=1 Tax=Phyllobacterium salinisoli TaxID=1899321 RepID=UPI0011C02BC5|nr:hypothetical protein [Phyllobacterium salinisoli]
MRELTLEEMAIVVGGGGRLDSGDHSDAYSGGRGSSSGAQSRGKGAGVGTGFGYSFNDQVEASKLPGNNPGWKDSILGRFTDALGRIYQGGGTPDSTGYTAMGGALVCATAGCLPFQSG